MESQFCDYTKIIEISKSKHDALSSLLYEIIKYCDIDKESYMIIGSYGLRDYREIGDLDVMMNSDQYKKLTKLTDKKITTGKMKSNNQPFWKLDFTDEYNKIIPNTNDFSIEIFDQNPDDGFPDKNFSLNKLKKENGLDRDKNGNYFFNLKTLLAWKKTMSRDKDLKDIQIIEKLFQEHEAYPLTLKIEPLYKNKYMLYRYNIANQKWRCVKNSSHDNTCFDFLEKPIKKDNIKIISYNIWGALKDMNSPLFAFDMRAKAVSDILETENADIICLQEVSKIWIEYLLDQKWLQNKYYCTEKDGERVNIKFGLSNVIFSKFPLANITEYGLISMQMDMALYVEILVNGQNISLVTSQLHSQSEFREFRIMQLLTIFGIILKDKEQAIFVGDYNFGDDIYKWKENQYIDKSFQDAYRNLYPDASKNQGYTEDTNINIMRYMIKKSNKQERFDKLMYKGVNIKPTSFEILGKNQIGSVENIAIWPSDHFAISVVFGLK